MGASLRILVEYVLASKSIYYWPVHELSQLYLTMAYNKHCAARFKAMGLWRSVPSWKEEIKRQGNVSNLRGYLRAWAIVSIGKEWGQKENVNKTLTSSRKKRVNGSNDSTAFFRLLLYLESYWQVPSRPNSNIILAACSSSSNSKSGPNAPVQPILQFYSSLAQSTSYALWVQLITPHLLPSTRRVCTRTCWSRS